MDQTNLRTRWPIAMRLIRELKRAGAVTLGDAEPPPTRSAPGSRCARA